MKTTMVALTFVFLTALAFWGSSQMEAGPYMGRKPFSFYGPYYKSQAYYPALRPSQARSSIHLNYTNGTFIFTPQAR